ncbi:polyprenyl synthetase family protein [Thermococcus waiotapuensis]|uniref:Polyprenyl synthetase family protein n=1 Tax=Thermococcus waiotapuensis TaxID=90909 RepID=A0AAE4T296_9EURY|nr:polyprenyl synthetase family protein [Thermococcus waiotapuensis]MDV3103882.1 polyprenyl synthetase family protein [Thermococcus waiotapuensis]
MESLDERLIEALEGSVELAKKIGEYMIRSGGKRIRPRITLEVSKGLGLDEEDAIDLASAVELIHTASLIHDDVIDLAEKRRNSPTVPMQWGPELAVLSGDFLFVRALRIIASKRAETVDYVARVVEEMVKAEILQETVRGSVHLDTETYYRIIDGKTGKLFGASFALPAHYMGKPFWGELDKAGTLVGRAFQIVDDVLDYFPGTGKDRFKDLLNGKTTLPLILYSERYGSRFFEKVLREPTEENLLDLFERMSNAGVFREAIETARGFLREACESIGALPFESSRVISLVDEYFEGVFEKFEKISG